MQPDVPAFFAMGSLPQLVDRLLPHSDRNLRNLVALALNVIAGVSFAAQAVLFFALGLRWPAGVSASAALVHVVAAGHAGVTKASAPAVQALCWTLVLGPLLLQLCFGGGAGGAGVLAIAYLGPALYVVFETPKSYVPWAQAALILAASLALCVAERVVGAHGLFPPVQRLPRGWYDVCFWLNVQVPYSVMFMLFATAVLRLDCGRERLAEGDARLEHLNEEFLAQKGKMELQQNLAHSLLFNIFPAHVSVALVQSIENASESRAKSARDLLKDVHRNLDHSGPQSVYTVQVTSVEEEAPEDRARAGSCGPALADVVERSLAPQLHPVAVLLFADVVGFTALSSRTDPRALVQWLDTLFGQIDEVVQDRRVEKIKTMGDCYMAMALPEEEGASPAHVALQMLRVSQQMHRIISQTPLQGTRLAFRAGLHVGPVVSGIIGKTKFAYDVWGDTVNTASRMESTGVAGATQVSEEVFQLLRAQEAFSAHVVDVKGKGKLQTYINTPPSATPKGAVPFATLNVVRRFRSMLSDT